VADVPGPLADAGGSSGGGMKMDGTHGGTHGMQMVDGGTSATGGRDGGTRKKARQPKADGGSPADGGMKHDMPGMKMVHEP
jgi:hypothetical protein